MLYHLEGTVTELSHDTLVLDCSGVGFEVTITPNTASSMKRGEKGKVYITESISENSFDLYGFLTWREKQFFKMLTSVSGVGPKAAMSILSYNTPDSLAISIVNENEKALTACPGIGKKTAQRIILELKDKFTKEIAAEGLPASPAKGWKTNRRAVGPPQVSPALLPLTSSLLTSMFHTAIPPSKEQETSCLVSCR